LESVVAAGMDGFYTALPAQVVSFDQNFCTASVRPLVMRGRLAENGERVVEVQPATQECPVLFPGGSAGQITTPVRVGDHGILLLTSCQMDRYQATGLIADPLDDRRNTLSSGVFLLGACYPLATPPEGYDDDATVIRGNVKLSTHQTTQSAVRGTDFANALNTLLDLVKDVSDQLIASSTPLGPYPGPYPMPALFTAATTLSAALALFDTGDHLSATVELE